MEESKDLFEKGLSYNTEYLNRMFTLATGALVLSITFRSSIVSEVPRFLWMLSLSWVLLIICIMSHLAVQLGRSLHFMLAAAKKTDEAVDALKEAHKAEKFSLACFSGGIIALGVFAILNNG